MPFFCERTGAIETTVGVDRVPDEAAARVAVGGFETIEALLLALVRVQRTLVCPYISSDIIFQKLKVGTAK